MKIDKAMKDLVVVAVANQTYQKNTKNKQNTKLKDYSCLPLYSSAQKSTRFGWHV